MTNHAHLIQLVVTPEPAIAAITVDGGDPRTRRNTIHGTDTGPGNVGASTGRPIHPNPTSRWTTRTWSGMRGLPGLPASRRPGGPRQDGGAGPVPRRRDRGHPGRDTTRAVSSSPRAGWTPSNDPTHPPIHPLTDVTGYTGPVLAITGSQDQVGPARHLGPAGAGRGQHRHHPGTPSTGPTTSSRPPPPTRPTPTKSSSSPIGGLSSGSP